jgi:hypothetical protein
MVGYLVDSHAGLSHAKTIVVQHALLGLSVRLTSSWPIAVRCATVGRIVAHYALWTILYLLTLMLDDVVLVFLQAIRVQCCHVVVVCNLRQSIISLLMLAKLLGFKGQGVLSKWVVCVATWQFHVRLGISSKL